MTEVSRPDPTVHVSAVIRAQEALLLKGGRWRTCLVPVRHLSFDHPRLGRCLIDTGYTARLTTGRRSLPLRLYSALLRPEMRVTDSPAAVETIILTHLHVDHVCGLRDYPSAQIYAAGNGLDAYAGRSGPHQLRHGVFAELFPDDLRERAIRFESLPQVEAPLGLGPAADICGDGSLLAVPLPGHMRGHTGILWPNRPRPLLYAADAEWLAAAVMEERPPGYPGALVPDDPAAAVETRARLRAFTAAGGEVWYCHDPSLTG
jgi:glyoxylase-like metal-dependent hydrolase (beta-lactamase superfamily II)